MIVRRLTDQQRPLAKPFYQRLQKSMRPKGQDTLWVVQANEQVIGAVKRRQLDGYYLLTGLLVAPPARSRGLGQVLVNAVIADTLGPIWLLCQPELVPWYQTLGFTLSPPPPAIAEKQRRIKRQVSALVYNLDNTPGN